MRASVPLLVAGLVVAGLAGCGKVDDYVVVHTTTLEHELGDAQRLVVRNRFGRIRLTPCDGDVVTVKAEFKVPESHREQLAGVGIRDLSLGLEPLSRTVYGAEGDDLVVACGQDDSPLASGVVTELEIRAPATVPWHVWGNAGVLSVQAGGNDVAIDADLGSIELSGHAGKVRLGSTVSPIEVDVTGLGGGSIEARGGDIVLRVRESGPSEDLTLLTLDGDVTLELPAALAAEFELRSALGDVELSGASGVTVKEERKGHSAAGSTLGGGPKIRASAETGDVTVKLGR